MLTQDGLGPVLRGLFTYTCTTSFLADNVGLRLPSIGTARDLVRLPTTDEICPDLFPVKGEGSAEGSSGDGSTTTTTDETTDETTSTTTTTDETMSTDTTAPDGSTVDPTTAEPGSATETTTTDGAP